MTRIPRFAAVFVVLLVVAAACGGDDDTGADETTTVASETTAADDATTTMADESTTTAAETTTTAAPETTTTAAPETTTTATATPPGEAEALVVAKTEAAIAAAPADWTATPVDTDLDAGGSDEIYGECAGPGAFDLANLQAATIAAATVDVEGPQEPGSFFPGPQASIEARVFESPAVAAEAFDVLETVLGTEDGRECLTEQFIGLLGEGMPADAVFSLDVQEVSVSGADVGIRLVLEITAEGLTLEFQFELAAGLDGDCTVYGTFFAFGTGEPFDPAVRDALFAAASGV